MPLREHLAELRRRVIIAVVAIALGSVAGWYLYDFVWAQLSQPLEDIAEERGVQAQINISGVATAFNLQVKLAIYMGFVIASPVWLYEIWAFIMPGLTRKERRTSMAFVGAAVPLFLGGITVAWLVLPNAVKLLTEFSPDDASNIINAEDYLTFATRLMLAFGVAFVVPLLLVALNLVGMLSGATLAKHWRISVFVVFLFTAIASPSPDVGSMLAMAFPMIGLYLLTVGFCILNDRRRARRRANDPVFGLSDEEASPLPEPAPVDRPTSIDNPAAIDDDAT